MPKLSIKLLGAPQLTLDDTAVFPGHLFIDLALYLKGERDAGRRRVGEGLRLAPAAAGQFLAELVELRSKTAVITKNLSGSLWES